MRVRVCAACLVLVSLSASQWARAQATSPGTPPAPSAPAASAAPVAPAPPATVPLTLRLSLGNSKLDAEAVRRAVELELKRPVALSKAAPATEAGSGAPAQSLSVVVQADHTVSVSYRAANGVTRTRTIGLPQDDARGPEVIALLSGNLSRDEAAELLAGLAAKANAPTADESALPATEPAAEPAKRTETAPTPSAKPAETASKNRPKPSSSSGFLRAPYPLFDLTLSHPLGLVPHSERYVINGELGLVYSRIGELEGAGVNVMVLRTEGDMHGVSYATFYNHTGGIADGVAGSGLVTQGGGVRGASISGLVTIESGDVRWFSFGGIANTYRDMHGCALSGIANIGRDVQGCSVTGAVNWMRDGSGIQVAGVVNRARRFEGLQLGAITNIADEITGMQIGVVNVARNVRGMQIGVVNVAKHVDGAAFGLVSVAGNGRVQPVLWASTFMPFNAAAKFTVGSFYTQLGGGYSPSDHTFTYELGLGAHLPVGPIFFEPGVHYSGQRATERAFSSELSENLHYRLAAGLDLRAVSPFVGVAVQQRIAHAIDASDSVPVTLEGFGGVAFF